MDTQLSEPAMGHGWELRSLTTAGTSGARMIFPLVILGDACHPDG